MYYKVRKIFTYSEEVVVEAESSTEAKDIAMEVDGLRIYDDCLYDCEILNWSETPIED
jgi:hypothetical protein